MAEVIGKIYYKLDLFAKDFLLRATLFVGSVRLTAWVLGLVAAEVNSAGKFTVLCLGRSIFLDDVKALASFSGRLKYLVIHRRYWKTIFYHCLDNDEKNLIEEVNYHRPDFCEAGKKKYFDYLGKLLPVLKTKLGFAAVLSGNFGYLEQQELAAVCEVERIPFIVLHKEGLAVATSMDSFAFLAQNYRFRGAKLLVYNEKIKQALLTSGLLGLSKEKVEVVGVPRLDSYFLVPPAKLARRQVVFFSFYPSDKFFFLFSQELGSDSAKLKKAAVLTEDFHYWLMEFASRHPDITVVIKTKAALYYLDYVKEIYKRRFSASKPLPNLIMTNAGDPVSLIRNSFAVLGFSSTTLIEAVIAGKIIISPDFGDFFASQRTWDYFVGYPELIAYVRSKAELDDRLLQAQSSRPSSAETRLEFLKDLIYLPDGRASQRAEEAIIKVIKQK